MTQSTFKAIIGLVIMVVGFVLTFVWFGWQFLLVITLLMWGNNIGQNMIEEN